MGEAAYTTGEWTSADGLTLRYRDYPATNGSAQARPPLLCIPGLTRNARDFEPIGAAFSGEWRVICVDLRGRGQSDYAKDTGTYTPAHYVADIIALFHQITIERAIIVGTSLGGIVAMLLALQAPERIAAVVLNDIGPAVEPAGLARIRDYVGQGRSFPTWMHAARGLREQGGMAYPNYAISDWLKLAKRLMVVGSSGRIVFDYDMKIAEPFQAPTSADSVDMWPAFHALSGRPVLAIRGALSDILSAATLKRMKKDMPAMHVVTIPGLGHAPTLEEPEAQAAIAALLAEVA